MERDDPLAFAKGLRNGLLMEAAAFVALIVVWQFIWAALPGLTP